MNNKNIFRYIRTILLAIWVCILNNHINAAEQINRPETAVQHARQSSYLEQGIKFVREHPVIAISGAVVIGAVLVNTFAPSLMDSATQATVETVHHCIEVPKEYLIAIAKNVSTSAEGYESKIYGWISKCYNPNLYVYKKYFSEYFYESFAACNKSCWWDVERTGSTTSACYDFVECWVKKGSDILTCGRPTTSWYVSVKEIAEKYWSDFASLGLSPPRWYNTSTAYLGDLSHLHPQLGFHYDVKTFCSMCPRAWDCINKLMAPQ